MKYLNLNGSKLRDLASKTPTSQLISDILSRRERMRSSIKFIRLKKVLMMKGEDFVIEDCMSFFKALEEEKLGTIVYNHKGKPQEFLFNYDLRSIGDSCVYGKDEIALELPRMAYKQQITVSKGVGSKDLIKPSVMPFKLNIEIPSDLSEDRIHKLIEVLRTL